MTPYLAELSTILEGTPKGAGWVRAREAIARDVLSSVNDINRGSTGPNGWLQGNKNMAAALKAKGYQYIFMTGNGQHYRPVQADRSTRCT